MNAKNGISKLKYMHIDNERQVTEPSTCLQIHVK